MEYISNNIDQDIQHFAGVESGVLGKNQVKAMTAALAPSAASLSAELG